MPEFGIEGLDDFEREKSRGVKSRQNGYVAREMRRIGEADGFVSREPRQSQVRVRRAQAGAASLNVRLEVHEFNRFVRLSQDARLGRADFIVALMDAYEAAKPR